jgi:hypothetical protein
MRSFFNYIAILSRSMLIDYISWIDLILVPLYFIFLFSIMVLIKKRNPGNILYQKYLLKGFSFKIAGALFYGLLVYFYYGDGDSFNYFREAMMIRQQIENGTENFTVLFAKYSYVRNAYDMTAAGHEGGWLVEKIVLLISYISFSRYMVTTMIFAALAFSGMMKMLETFAELMPRWHKYVAFIVLFFPSLAVYGSGILKDTVCISAMGWLLYSSNHFFVKKERQFKYVAILLLSATLIIMIKIYILAAFVVPYLIYLFLRYVQRIENALLRKLVLPILLGIMVLAYFSFSTSIDASLGMYATDNLLESVQEQQNSYLSQQDAESGAVFNLGTLDPTLTGFLKMMPAGIVATLFRPFIWEAKKVIMLFSALESLAMLLFTLYVIWQAGIVGFFKWIKQEPFIFLCISYALIFAALVGLSTYNFGTLARYRIPIIPFYLVGLLYILYKVRYATPKMPHENTA